MLGVPLYRPPLPPAQEKTLQAAIDSAAAAFRAKPTDPGALLALGRRLADAAHYREAIATFTRGIRLHPADARYYRHRAQSYITSRQFDLAIADLEVAADLTAGQPDQPDQLTAITNNGMPQGTLHASIYFYLGLAHYLRHDFERALPYWRTARGLARDHQLFLAASEWLYMAYRRLGLDREAAELLRQLPTQPSMTYDPEWRQRIRLYQGEVQPEAVVGENHDAAKPAHSGYALANWFLYTGQRARARELLRSIVQTSHWDHLGFIAAEVELGEGMQR